MRWSCLSSISIGIGIGVALLLASGCDRDDPDHTSEVDTIPSGVERGGLRSPFSTSEAQPAAGLPASAATPLGDLAKAQDYEMVARLTKQCRVETYFEPRPGNIKLGVEVVVRGLGDREVPVNPFHAKVRDGDGNTYTATLAGCNPTLKSQRVQEGEEARGYITFELPAAAEGLTMSYEPFIVGRSEQRLEFALGNAPAPAQ